MDLAKLAKETEGKMEPAAGNSLNLRMGHVKGRVIVDFGTSVGHLEMAPQDAENLAIMLQQHAHLAKMGR